MNEENTKKLMEFGFFKPDNLSSLMRFGFACGNGWFDILLRLCQDIDKMDKPENFEVMQVKEKFGSLRFYCRRTTIKVNKRIADAESESYSVCEVCGNEGSYYSDGWIKTLCLSCIEDRKNR